MLSTGVDLQGRYRIERILGQGGMGTVYLATEKLLGGKRVAIKEMILGVEDSADRESAVELFQREASILATLDHPGLVDVTHYFEEAGKYYLVMAYIAGHTLDRVIREATGHLPVDQVVDWVDQLADVLDYLHDQEPPIIFRDLKPSNVMLDIRRRRIRLIDFGIARAFGPGKTDTFIKGAGTDGFAPIEQYGRNGTTDTRTDVYALGATMYSLLTRKLPPSAVDLMMHDDVLLPPSEMNPGVSQELDAIVLKMMALIKDDRYQNMGAVREALQAVWVCPVPSGVNTDEMSADAKTMPRRHTLALPHQATPAEATALPRTMSPPAPVVPESQAPPPVPVAVPPPIPARPVAGPRRRLSAMTLGLLGVLICVSVLAFFPPSFQTTAPPVASFSGRSVTLNIGEATTTLEVDSVPSGAEVFVDSKKVGTTPFKGSNFTLGLHWIMIRKAGYHDVHAKGRLSDGIPNRLNAHLTPI